MRGKRYYSKRKTFGSRITPADAGKTAGSCDFFVTDEDHPRGCGENCQNRRSSLHASGSPPRMRGKPAQKSGCLPRWRITPADAGKTGLFRFAILRNEDHPRGCGENLPQIELSTGKKGSPPRMRGKQRGSTWTAQVTGITPADAGKTCKFIPHITT